MASVPRDDDFADSAGEAPVEARRSTLAVLRNVVLDLTHVVEDSTELIGASVHEELAQFREDMARHALSIISVIIGGVLISAGAAIFVSDYVGWPVTLVSFGAIYVGFAIALRVGRGRDDDDEGWK